MNTLLFLTLVSLSTLSFAGSSINPTWLKEHCDNCQRTADGYFSFVLQGQIIKYDIKLSKPNPQTDHLDIIWMGVIDKNGRPSRQTFSFPDGISQSQVYNQYKRLCQMYQGFEFWGAKQLAVDYTEGGEEIYPARAKLNMTCYKRQRTFMDKVFSFINGDGWNEQKNINDSDRSQYKEIQVEAGPEPYESSVGIPR